MKADDLIDRALYLAIIDTGQWFPHFSALSSC
jgi:hypothetical protein